MASVLRFDDWETTLGTGVVSTDGSGNVAVGGSSPSYKLDVTGDINATGDLRIGGTAVGETTAYTPTISALTGSGYAFTLNAAYYAQVNDLYVVWFNFSVTAGTGSGEFAVTLPTNRVSETTGNARELAVNGLTWTASQTGTANEVKYSRYDNAGSVASGNNFGGFAIFGA